MADKSAVTANAKAGGVLRRLARLALAGLAVATAIPAVIVPLYAFVDPPFSTLMLRDRLSGHSYERQWIDLDEVAPVMAHSVVVSEDSLFCMHNGIDWKQMQIAIDQWKAGKEPRGASTIAMQTAKNLFLWPARSYVRKAIELPLADKATCEFGFVGTDTEPPTTTRASQAANAITPIAVEAFNTTADIARLRITQTNETTLTTYFKSITLTINNNVTPEKVLASLGAAFMNIGNFDVNIEAQVIFTDKDIPSAIRNNTTLTMDFSLENNDGGFFFDFPSITIGGGDKELPENESVLINVPATAFEDTTLGYSMSISHFPFVPAS